MMNDDCQSRHVAWSSRLSVSEENWEYSFSGCYTEKKRYKWMSVTQQTTRGKVQGMGQYGEIKEVQMTNG